MAGRVRERDRRSRRKRHGHYRAARADLAGLGRRLVHDRRRLHHRGSAQPWRRPPHRRPHRQLTGTGMDVAQPGAAPVGRAGFRRLLVSLGIAGGALSAMYAGVGTVLLPLQIEHIDRAHKIAALGVVAGVSAVFALVFNPVGGALSDRTRSRFGRRAPWLVAASAALLVMLALLGQAATVPLVLVAWCLAQAAANL